MPLSDADRIQPIFLPSGIFSPDRQVGYFTNINHGIDAIDLKATSNNYSLTIDRQTCIN